MSRENFESFTYKQSFGGSLGIFFIIMLCEMRACGLVKLTLTLGAVVQALDGIVVNCPYVTSARLRRRKEGRIGGIRNINVKKDQINKRH